jgi:hypothetical protein
MWPPQLLMYMPSDLPFLYVPIYSIPCRTSHTPSTASIFRRQTQLSEGSSSLKCGVRKYFYALKLRACTGSMHVVILRPTSTTCNFTLLHSSSRDACHGSRQNRRSFFFFPQTPMMTRLCNIQNSHTLLLMIDVAQMDSDSDFGLAQPSFPRLLEFFFPPCGAYDQSSVQGCPLMPTIALIHAPTFATDHFCAPVLVSDPLDPLPLWEGAASTVRQLQFSDKLWINK